MPQTDKADKCQRRQAIRAIMAFVRNPVQPSLPAQTSAFFPVSIGQDSCDTGARMTVSERIVRA